jgi:soluble lytic murein transglycosylase-like protein
MAEAVPIVAVTGLTGAPDPLPHAAALAVALSGSGTRRVVMLEVGAEGRRRPTLLSSRAARALERALPDLQAAARGSVCWATCEREGWREACATCVAAAPDAIVIALPPRAWRELVDERPHGLAAALLTADLPRQRALAALAVRDLHARRIRAAVRRGSAGLVAARRAIAGIDPGGELGASGSRLAARLLDRAPRRPPAPAPRPPSRAVGSQAGQALPLVLALALAIVVAGAVVAMLGVAATAGGRLQRAADLAAVSAARSMRDDHARLFLPARLPAGAPNPRHLTEDEYRRRASAAADRAAAENGVARASVEVAFAGSDFAPTRVEVTLSAAPPPDAPLGGDLRASATAEAYPAAIRGASAETSLATGGGYSGDLAERQGERMRPDVAAAFDRLQAAARSAGHQLLISSAFRSDAEQAALFAANPDPRWVARPGTSLHRCATELDLGPPTAYAWLAANAERFGFLKRYSWEPWHFGYTAGPAPCSAAGDRVGEATADGAIGSRALPSFVPARFRAPLAAAASRWNVSAPLLAAQLMAESGFNPSAVSPAGASGIAQFMPATAAAYGLSDPFDARAAIAAQARLMSDLLRQFGRVELALAAYNAGPGAVAACGCIPPYPETQAYVARIMGLLAGAGVAPPPTLEVRLVA